MARRLTDEDVKARADKLWERYERNGKSIMRGEVEELLGVAFYSAYPVFERRGIPAPLPDDTARGRLKKKAEILNSAGKAVLTTAEVSELLGLDGASSSHDYYPQIAKHFPVPKMINTRERTDIEIPLSNRDTFYERHPSGLQAEPVNRLIDGRVVYKLR